MLGRIAGRSAAPQNARAGHSVHSELVSPLPAPSPSRVAFDDLGEDVIRRIIAKVHDEGHTAEALFYAHPRFTRSPAIRREALTAAIDRNFPLRSRVMDAASTFAWLTAARMQKILFDEDAGARPREAVRFVAWAAARGPDYAFDASIFAFELLRLAHEPELALRHVLACVRPALLVAPQSHRRELFFGAIELTEELTTRTTQAERDLRSQSAADRHLDQTLEYLATEVPRLAAVDRKIAAAAIAEASKRISLESRFHVWAKLIALFPTFPEAYVPTSLARVMMNLPPASTESEMSAESTLCIKAVAMLHHVEDESREAVLRHVFGRFSLHSTTARSEAIAALGEQLTRCGPRMNAAILRYARLAFADMRPPRSSAVAKLMFASLPRFAPEYRVELFALIAPGLPVDARIATNGQANYAGDLIDPNHPFGAENAMHELFARTFGHRLSSGTGPFAMY